MKDGPAIYLGLVILLGLMGIGDAIENAAEISAQTVCEARHE